jgi:hypothetical protein
MWTCEGFFGPRVLKHNPSRQHQPCLGRVSELQPGLLNPAPWRPSSLALTVFWVRTTTSPQLVPAPSSQSLQASQEGDVTHTLPLHVGAKLQSQLLSWCLASLPQQVAEECPQPGLCKEDGWSLTLCEVRQVTVLLWPPKSRLRRALMALSCNPSYSGSRNQDCG